MKNQTRKIGSMLALAIAVFAILGAQWIAPAQAYPLSDGHGNTVDCYASSNGVDGFAVVTATAGKLGSGISIGGVSLGTGVYLYQIASITVTVRAYDRNGALLRANTYTYTYPTIQRVVSLYYPLPKTGLGVAKITVSASANFKGSAPPFGVLAYLWSLLTPPSRVSNGYTG